MSPPLKKSPGFHYNCSQCGQTLLKVTFQDYAEYCHRINPTTKTYAELVVEEIGGKCPRCGHVLAKVPIETEVYAVRKKAEK